MDLGFCKCKDTELCVKGQCKIISLVGKKSKKELLDYALELEAKEVSGKIKVAEQAVLSGIRRFDDNPSAATLEAKELLGIITPQERQALSGYRESPDNLYFAELVRKDKTGEITQGEKEELDKFRKSHVANLFNSLDETLSHVRNR